MIVIECDKCHARFRMDPQKISPKGSRVRCAKCQNVFLVMPPSAEGAPPSPETGAAPPPMAEKLSTQPEMSAPPSPSMEEREPPSPEESPAPRISQDLFDELNMGGATAAAQAPPAAATPPPPPVTAAPVSEPGDPFSLLSSLDAPTHPTMPPPSPPSEPTPIEVKLARIALAQKKGSEISEAGVKIPSVPKAPERRQGQLLVEPQISTGQSIARMGTILFVCFFGLLVGLLMAGVRPSVEGISDFFRFGALPAGPSVTLLDHEGSVTRIGLGRLALVVQGRLYNPSPRSQQKPVIEVEALNLSGQPVATQIDPCCTRTLPPRAVAPFRLVLDLKTAEVGRYKIRLQPATGGNNSG